MRARRSWRRLCKACMDCFGENNSWPGGLSPQGVHERETCLKLEISALYSRIVKMAPKLHRFTDKIRTVYRFYSFTLFRLLCIKSSQNGSSKHSFECSIELAKEPFSAICSMYRRTEGTFNRNSVSDSFDLDLVCTVAETIEIIEIIEDSTGCVINARWTEISILYCFKYWNHSKILLSNSIVSTMLYSTTWTVSSLWIPVSTTATALQEESSERKRIDRRRQNVKRKDGSVW